MTNLAAEARTANPRRPRWRRWALSLRGLMVLVLVIGGALGWWVRQVSVRRAAVATIRASGGTVTFRDEALTPTGAWVWLYRRTGLDLFREVWAVALMDGGTSPPPAPSLAPTGPPTRSAAFEAIGHLGWVEAVSVHNGTITPADLATLARAECREVGLYGISGLTAAMAAEVGRMRGLKSLRIQTAKGGLDPAIIRAVAALPLLEDLELVGFGPLAAVDLVPLGRLARIKALGIVPAPQDPAALDPLLTHHRMTGLNLSNMRVTDAQLHRLVAAMPGLTSLALDGALLTDAGVEALAGLPRLTALSLTPHWRPDPTVPNHLTDASLRTLGRLPGLRNLLIYSGRFSAAGLDALAGLPLQNLVLGSIESADNASLAHLLAGRTWGVLGLHGPGITDASLPTIAAAVNGRTNLDLSYTGVTDAGMGTLAPAGFGQLALTGTAMTDAGLATLAASSTSRLTAAATRVTPAGAAAFRAARPGTTLYIGPVENDD